MPSAQLEQFVCEGCGKSYRWKAELGGKRVKCKCGHTMTVPLPPEPKAVEDSDDPFGDALSAMVEAEQNAAIESDLPRCPSCRSEMSHGATVCTQCGYNVNTGKSKKSKSAQAVGVGGADGTFAVAAVVPLPGASAPGTPLAYAGMPVRRRAVAEQNRGDNSIGDPVKDLYLPIGLFLLGVALTFVEGRYGRGIADVQFCLLFTTFVIAINLVFSFIGIMMAVKMLDLGLGPIGPAFVKIAAVSALPGAVAGMMWHVVGPSGFFLIWVVNLILIYAMFMGMLGLDFQETGICTCIIWVMRTWVGYALTFAILGAFGMRLAGSGAAGSSAMSAMSGPSSSGFKSPTPPKPKMTAAQLETVCTTLISQNGAVELREWIKLPTPKGKDRNFYRMTDIPSQRAIDGVYAMGAPSILVTKTLEEAHDLVPRQLIFTMPKDKASRQGIVWWARSYTKEFGGISEIDNGQDHLLVDFDHKMHDVDWYDNGLYDQHLEGDGSDPDGSTAPGL